MEKKKIYTLRDYCWAGGKNLLILNLISDVFKEIKNRNVAKQILNSLITIDNNLRELTISEISFNIGRKEKVITSILKTMLDNNLVQKYQKGKNQYYKLSHEYLIHWIDILTSGARFLRKKILFRWNKWKIMYGLDTRITIPFFEFLSFLGKSINYKKDAAEKHLFQWSFKRFYLTLVGLLIFTTSIILLYQKILDPFIHLNAAKNIICKARKETLERKKILYSKAEEVYSKYSPSSPYIPIIYIEQQKWEEALSGIKKFMLKTVQGKYEFYNDALNAYEDLCDNKTSQEERELLEKALDIQGGYKSSHSVYVMDTLEKIRDPNLIPLLNKALVGNNTSIKYLAANILASRGDYRSVPYFIQILQRNKPVDNNIIWYAIESLGKLKILEAIPYLLEFLYDEDPQIREETVRALGKIGGNFDPQVLVDALKGRSLSVRDAAVEAIAEVQNNKIFPSLYQLLDSQDESVKLAAYGALYKLGEISDFSLLTDILLESNFPESRKKSARILKTIKNPSTLPFFIKSLNDPDKAVREISINTIGEIGDLSVLPILKNIFEKEKEESVREAVLWGIYKIGGRDIFNSLFPSIKNDPSENVKKTAISIIEDDKNPEHIRFIKELLQDKSKYVRDRATKASGKICDASFTPYLLRELESSKQSPSVYIIEALGKIGDPSSAYILLEVLKNTDNCYIKVEAAMALKVLKDSAGIPLLKKVLKNGSFLDQWASAYALSESGDYSGFAFLIKGLHTKIGCGLTSVKYRSIWRLLNLKTTKIIPDLINIALEEDYKIKLYVLWILGSIIQENFIQNK